MDFAAALSYLDRHVNLEATAGRVEGLSLERMARLVEVLGDPQRAYPVIHLTGTNGKGSTARMITSLLRASGLSVGTYTSPHLERITERLAWNADTIGPDDFGALVGDVAAVEPLSGVTPSYFELVTAAAFRWFAEVAVDVAVVEVGLLGRYDATNVADGTVAVVTNVGHDHTDGGPGWREAVAREKAGIVKPGATLVLGETDPELRRVFADTPAGEIWARGDHFACETNQVAFGGRVCDLRTPGGTAEEIFVPLHGAHQGDNAAVALAGAEAFFGRALDEEVVTSAFAEVSAPGRFEVVGRDPTVVLDGAHNVDGAAAAAQTLHEDFTLLGALIVVVGLLEGRDPAEVLSTLEVDQAALVITCTPPSPRGVPAADLAVVAAGLGAEVEAVADPVEAVARARALAGEDDLILVTGSLYVVGAARSSLLAEVRA